MKKLSLLFLALLAFGAFFQSCNDQKTYAEMLEDERRAIKEFIKKHNIKTITQEEFEKDTITNENEYALLSGGVYLQIVDRGEGDTVKNRDQVLLRLVERNILGEIDKSLAYDTLSNIDWPYDSYVDAFYYTPNSSSVLFTQGRLSMKWNNGSYVGGLDVPRGIIDIIPYIKDKAHVKLIVPSKKGHSGANGMYSIYPMYYDIHKIQIR